MAVMTATPDPGPGERRLERPPSDRYEAEETAGPEAAAGGDGSVVRGILLADVAAVVGAFVTVVFGGVLAFSAGLLVVAAAAGYATGYALAFGAGSSIDRPTRPWVAFVLAALGFILGQVGLWWYASIEGGVLPLMDYLWQTFGVLVPVQGLLAAGTAYWAAR